MACTNLCMHVQGGDPRLLQHLCAAPRSHFTSLNLVGCDLLGVADLASLLSSRVRASSSVEAIPEGWLEDGDEKVCEGNRVWSGWHGQSSEAPQPLQRIRVLGCKGVLQEVGPGGVQAFARTLAPAVEVVTHDWAIADSV